jgi:hypothetical protein
MDLRYSLVSRGLHPGDARVAIVTAQPTGFGEFGGGAFAVTFEGVGGSELGADIRMRRSVVARLFKPDGRFVCGRGTPSLSRSVTLNWRALISRLISRPPIRFRDRKPVDPRDQHRDRPPRALPSAMEDKIQILSVPRFAVAVSSQSCRARCDRTFARRWVAEAAIAGAIRMISLAKPSSSTRRPYSLFVHQRCHLSGKPFQTLDALCNGLAATIED